MNPIEQPVRTWIATQRDQEVLDISHGIENGVWTLLELVKALGEYLTSEEIETRSRGVSLLAEVISKLPASKINRQSTKVLVAFFIAKLEDIDGIIPALKSLLILSELTTFTPGDCKDVINGIFDHITMKSHVQSTRHVVFSIIDSLMARHRNTLKEMGEAFVKGYIGLAEGEKDPRNLLLAFALDKVILLEFEASKFIEQFYDITFCYFPITFKAPANDPYGISTKDLVDALRGSLSASPLFGPLGMPLFIEKINAGSPPTKKDTFSTVAACLPVYGRTVCENFGDKLWDGLKIEIFQPVDDEVQTCALNTTQVLIRTCHEEGSPLEGVPARILEGCLEILKEPEKSRAKPAVKVINIFIGCSEDIATFTLQKTIKRMIDLYNDPQNIATRPHILNTITSILEATRLAPWFLTWAAKGVVENSPLLSQKDSIISILNSGLEVTSTSEASLETLHQLLQLRLLSQEEIEYITHGISKLLNSPNGDLITEALTVLQTLTSISPKTIEEISLPILFGFLPDTAPSKGDVDGREGCIHALSSLEVLCTHPHLFERLIVHLTTKIEFVNSQTIDTGSGLDLDGLEASIVYAHAMFKTLDAVITKKLDQDDKDVAKYIERFVPRLYYLFFEAAVSTDGQKPVGQDPRLISDASEIVSSIVSVLPPERQISWLSAVFDAFVHGKPQKLAFQHSAFPETGDFQPLKMDASVTQRKLIPLFSAALLALRVETAIPVEDLSRFLDELVQLGWRVNNHEQRESLIQLSASILNKHADEVGTFITTSMSTVWSERVLNGSQEKAIRKQGLKTWTSLLQGLIIRNHQTGVALVKTLFQLFDDPDLAWDAARAFGEVMTRTGRTFTKRYHAILRLLYNQRIFNAVLPEIVEGSTFSIAFSASRQSAYLVALASLVGAVPRSTYAHAIETISPLLLRGLELPDAGLRANIVEALFAILQSDDPQGVETISNHLGTLVTAMLRNSQLDDESTSSSVRLRIGAVRFLGAVSSKFEYEKLHPFKANVLRGLQRVLDDPRKAVRLEAVEARSNWFKCTG